MKIALLIPTLNEINGVTAIMPMVKREWIDEVVFVDGDSTDGTVEYIKQHGYILFLEKGRGIKDTLVEAINSIESDTIITFSPDGNCIPELIPILIEKMKEGYDMVIASRYLSGAKSYDDSLITAFGNWMFTNLINLLHGGRYTDTMNMYRIYKKKLIKDLELDKLKTYATAEKLFQTRLGWEPELSIRAARRKLKIAEIPGDEPPRIGGKAKLKVLKWGAGYLFQVFRDVLFWH